MSYQKWGRYAKWAEDYHNYLDSGLTADEWCRNNGVSLNTFNYRNSRLREHLHENGDDFSKGSEDIILESDGRRIRLSGTVETEKLKLIMELFMSDE